MSSVQRPRGRLFLIRGPTAPKLLSRVSPKLLCVRGTAAAHAVGISGRVQFSDEKAVLSQRWPRDARDREPLRRYGHSMAAILNLFESKIAPLDPPSPKTPPKYKTWSESDDQLRRYRHLKFFQHGGGRHLAFVRIVNSAVRSAVSENPTLEPNMKWIGSPVAEIWPFAYVGGIWNPHFGGREGRRGSAMAPLERAIVVSYRLSIVTVALSVTIQPQFAIECLRRSNQQGGGSLWAKI